jgi:hypothetical protein
MKLSKRALLIVITVIIVIALASLFTIYFRQAGERDQLNDRLDRARTLLPGLAANKESLEDQLIQAQSLLDTHRIKFPKSVESIEYGEYIFEIADRCNVKLSFLSFPKPTSTKIGGVTYSVASLSLPVSGTVADIFKFINTIKTDDRFASTQVNSVNLNVGGGAATISVDIYSYKGK